MPPTVENGAVAKAAPRTPFSLTYDIGMETIQAITYGFIHTDETSSLIEHVAEKPLR